MRASSLRAFERRVGLFVTLVVAFAVLGQQGVLPGPDDVDDVVGTRTGLYVVLLIATVLLGMAEVLRDNANQTILPNIVDADQLERANGRIWSVEAVTNQFAGPPLGSVLLLTAFALPFFVDAGTFFVAAAMVLLIPGTFRAERASDQPPQSFREELSEAVRRQDESRRVHGIDSARCRTHMIDQRQNGRFCHSATRRTPPTRGSHLVFRR